MEVALAAFPPRSVRALEVALEYPHVDQGRIAAVGPQVLRVEPDVVGRLVLGWDAMRVGIRERIGRRFTHDGADLAADIARQPDVARDEVELHAHPLARL